MASLDMHNRESRLEPVECRPGQGILPGTPDLADER